MTEVDTTTAGAGADSPGSFQDPETDMPEFDREWPCPDAVCEKPVLDVDDLKDDESEKDAFSFHGPAYMPSLSFHDDRGLSTAFTPLLLHPAVGTPLMMS